ncbi:MAG: type II toxin-antitoxin system RelE/ParE family toxin [Burkholderiaceae bacterium]|nr:type II toxin-antitoxin system RelE/ParE family toxin [Burkholderiaceae bacterium]MDO9090177.1 type II toxin-antitoxin system RelE/ParE family toxin [Burkholderiaceae bacterium]MDP1968208.1 type II toxin-antitoxin system RelE/ParE family toxin [Burkholderiaceae bacterium]
MPWRLEYDSAAAKELAKLDRGVQKKIKAYLAQVCGLADPTARGHGLTGPWAGFHRYRVGQLRIIVSIEHGVLTILVIKIDRRDSAYE